MNWPENGPRVLVFGNRTWACFKTIEAWLLPIQVQWIRIGASADNAPTVIHGAADGADMLAHEVAFQLGFRVKPCPPTDEEHRRFGPKAKFYARNRRMALEHFPHMGLGFGAVQKDPRKVDRSGSGHMLDILNELGIRVTMVASPGDCPGVFR